MFSAMVKDGAVTVRGYRREKKTRHQQRGIIVVANTEWNSCVIASELNTCLQSVNRRMWVSREPPERFLL